MDTARLLSILALSSAIATTAGVPRPAEAIDITSYGSSTAGAVVAIIGGVMMASDNEGKHKAGKTMLIAGLAVSVACSATAVILDLVALSTFTYDRVENLEAEVAAGGGPLTDAYSVAFGIPKAEVLSHVRASLAEVPVSSDADVKAFAENFNARLVDHAQITTENAQSIVYGLYSERRSAFPDEAPWHKLLSDLSGVPASALDVSIDRAIDERLREAANPGLVVSARSALSVKSRETLNTILDDILSSHEDDIVANFSRLNAELSFGHAAR